MMRTQFLSCAIVLLAAGSVPAATFDVDDTGDAVDAAPGDGVCASAGGACTLRAAVQETNALAGQDRILVPAGTYLLTIGGSFEDAAATGDLDVSDDLRVVGAGEDETIVDGNDLDRVLEVQGRVRVVLSRLAVRNGKTSDAQVGGGINAGSGSRLTLKRVAIDGNEAFGGGGVVARRLKVVASTFRDNVAAIAGGLAVLGRSTIRASTFDGNVATGVATVTGHDIAAQGPGTVTIVNSTITSQIQTYAMCNPPPQVTCSEGADVVLANVTVNAVSSVVIAPPFLHPDPGSFTLRNTIVEQCGADLVSQGYNFVAPEGCTILGDLTGVVVGDDPLLGSLLDNGGPTLTRLPVAVSAAVDGGNPATPGSGGFACEPFDQRGVPRFLGLGCDMGAVEGH